MNKFEEFYDYLVNYEVATEEEISLVCCINGYTVESLEGILYARLGLRSLEQLQFELNEV